MKQKTEKVTLRAFNVVFDTDDVNVNLPTEYRFDVENEIGIDIDEGLADLISDETGWCVKSYQYEVLTKDTPETPQVKIETE